jgi:predicted MFS family arabinose efflux permease
MGNILPPRARATGFSVRSGLWNLGYAISSVAAGVVIVWAGYYATFLAFAFFTTVSTVLFVGYFKRHPKLVEAPSGSGARAATSRAVRAQE